MLETSENPAEMAQNAQDPAIWTPKERVFAAIYLKSLNIREAADTLNITYGQAYGMLKKEHVNAYITRQLQAKIVDSLTVEASLGGLAGATIEDFITIGEDNFPRLDFNKAKQRGTLGNIKSLKYDSEGRPEIVLHDRMRALEMLAKRHGLLTENINVKMEGTINVQAVRAGMRSAMADPERLLAMIDVAEQLAMKQLPPA